MASNLKVGFLGAGRMASALARGFIQAGLVGPDQMLCPSIGALKFEPIEPAHIVWPSSEHKIEMAIPIDIDERSQAIIPNAVGGDWQIAGDIMMAECKIRDRGICRTRNGKAEQETDCC